MLLLVVVCACEFDESVTVIPARSHTTASDSTKTTHTHTHTRTHKHTNHTQPIRIVHIAQKGDKVRSCGFSGDGQHLAIGLLSGGLKVVEFHPSVAQVCVRIMLTIRRGEQRSLKKVVKEDVCKKTQYSILNMPHTHRSTGAS